MNLLVVSLTTM